MASLKERSFRFQFNSLVVGHLFNLHEQRYISSLDIFLKILFFHEIFNLTQKNCKGNHHFQISREDFSVLLVSGSNKRVGFEALHSLPGK